MPIASSNAVSGVPGIDGRFWVSERHTLVDGVVVFVEYLATNGDNIQSVMSARASAINDDLANSEFEGLINGP